MRWVIYKGPRQQAKYYWLGEMTKTGQPQKTRDKYLAKPFKTASEALLVATELKMWDWRVGLRTPTS